MPATQYAVQDGLRTRPEILLPSQCDSVSSTCGKGPMNGDDLTSTMWGRGGSLWGLRRPDGAFPAKPRRMPGPRCCHSKDHLSPQTATGTTVISWSPLHSAVTRLSPFDLRLMSSGLGHLRGDRIHPSPATCHVLDCCQWNRTLVT
jgi:hypothetical protein